MSNEVMPPLFHLIGTEEGNGLSPFCRGFDKNDDLRVSVETFLKSNSKVRAEIIEYGDVTVTTTNDEDEDQTNLHNKGNKIINISTETVESTVNTIQTSTQVEGISDGEGRPVINLEEFKRDVVDVENSFMGTIVVQYIIAIK